MGLSPEMSAGMLRYALLGEPFLPPAAQYVGLHAGDPEDGAPEVTTDRRPVSFIDRQGVLQSDGDLEFPGMAPTSAPVTHYALYDAPVRGRRVFSQEFTGDPKRLQGGETVRIRSGGIVIV